MMNGEAKLAWMLAEATAMRFAQSDRARVYAELGAGETLLAIGHMLAIVVSKQYPLPAQLVTALMAWLDGYVGTEHEAPIRNLLNYVRRYLQDSNWNVRRAERRLRARRTRTPSRQTPQDEFPFGQGAPLPTTRVLPSLDANECLAPTSASAWKACKANDFGASAEVLKTSHAWR
jgi:hypothetical protein